MPHGMCFAWEPSILWTTILSDLLIATSYFSIPIAILIYFKKRPPQKYLSLFILFAAFIFLCGITHLYSIHTLYNGSYGIHAMLKAVTGLVSFVTAVAVFYYLPLASKIPTQAELLAEKKKATENELFRVMSENSPLGQILVDNAIHIRHINRVAAEIFGYEPDELIGQPIGVLVKESHREKHASLIEQYLAAPVHAYNMASGRAVTAIRKSGDEISVEVGLSVGEFQSDKLVFVTVFDYQEKLKDRALLTQTLMKMDRIIDATEDGLWEWNIKTDEVWQSPKLLEMIGLSRDAEPSFDNWVQHLHPNHKDRVLKGVEEAVKNKQDYFVEYLGKTSEGNYQWIRSKGRLTLLDGEPYLLSGMITNIHKEITNSEQLKEKNDYLRKVVNRSINGLYIYSISKGANIHINEEYTEITGYELSDLDELTASGKFLELFHADDLDLVLGHMEQVANSKEGTVHSIQYRFKHKDGHWIWCLSRDSVFTYNEAGEADEMLGTFIDITNIKESEILQKQLTEDFQNTFELAAVGVAHVSLEGTWIKVNNKVCEILGYPREELLKTDFQTITYPDDLEIDLDHVRELISGQADSYDMEKRYIKKSGEVIWANLTVSIVRDDNGSPQYFISVIEDIEDRKLIEQQQELLNEDLAKSNEQLTRFAYSASHDMQEPLRKITSFSTSLISRLSCKELDEQSRFELERIAYAATRMKNMIDKLLELSRASNKVLNLSVFDCRVVIDEALDQLSVALSESNTEVQVKGEGAIYCDRFVLSNVFANLINNAIKYRSRDRKLEINIRIKSDHRRYTEISIQDNGIGFDNKYQREIFEPFKRLVANSEIEGTGMGLAICNQLVNLHQGVMLASGEEGVGATFIVKIPCNEMSQS